MSTVRTHFIQNPRTLPQAAQWITPIPEGVGRILFIACANYGSGNSDVTAAVSVTVGGVAAIFVEGVEPGGVRPGATLNVWMLNEAAIAQMTPDGNGNFPVVQTGGSGVSHFNSTFTVARAKQDLSTIRRGMAHSSNGAGAIPYRSTNNSFTIGIAYFDTLAQHIVLSNPPRTVNAELSNSHFAYAYADAEAGEQEFTWGLWTGEVSGVVLNLSTLYDFDVISINGLDDIRYGQNDVSLVIQGDFVPTSVMIGNVAATNIRGTFPNYLFDIPSFTDLGTIPKLHNSVDIIVSDGEVDLDFPKIIHEPLGYQTVELEPPLYEPNDGLLYHWPHLEDVPNTLVVYENRDDFRIYKDGTYGANRDESYNVWVLTPTVGGYTTELGVVTINDTSDLLAADLSLTGAGMVLQLVKHHNLTSLTDRNMLHFGSNMVDVGSPATYSDADGRDTQITLTAKGNQPVHGSVVVKYKRLDLEGFHSFEPRTLMFTDNSDITTANVAAMLNSVYGTNLAPDEIASVVDNGVSFESGDITITAASSSVGYTGSVTLPARISSADINVVFPETVIDGFYWSDVTKPIE